MTLMYEFFEHTADLGLRIRAADVDTLFAEAALALFAAIVEDPNTVEPRQRVDVELSGEEIEYLLFDWLNELLYRFDTEHVLFGRFEVHVKKDDLPGRTDCQSVLRGTAWGEPIDPARHALTHEVKAITYHGLSVQHTDDGWHAEVIVDI